MRVELLLPPPQLQPYVEILTWYEDYQPDYSHERILPQGVVELIIDLTAPPKFIYNNDTLAVSQTCRNAWVSGVRQEFITISSIPGSSMLVVRFREGMAHAALHIPLGLLKNQVLDADLLLNPDIARLREQLLNAPSPQQKFACTLAFLAERIRRRPDIHPAVAFSVQKILENPALVTIDELVRRTGWTHKHLIHVFDRFVGVSPKEFLRISRFQQVINGIGSKMSADWMRIVHDCGYYDQAHFIKDFKRFSGLSPEQYLTARGDDLNYLPLR